MKSRCVLHYTTLGDSVNNCIQAEVSTQSLKCYICLLALGESCLEANNGWGRESSIHDDQS